MLNKFLFWVLVRIYKVNPDFVNPVNWRIAHPAENISRVLQYRPLIFKGWKGKPQYGFERAIFIANGRVYLVPQLAGYEYAPTPENFSKSLLEAAEVKETHDPFNRLTVFQTLLKNYMEINPNILVKKFPTKLLLLLLKRNIPVVKNMLSRIKDNEKMSTLLTPTEAIRSDLEQGIKDSNTDLVSSKIYPDDSDID